MNIFDRLTVLWLTLDTVSYSGFFIYYKIFCAPKHNLTMLKSWSCPFWLHLISLAIVSALVSTTERLLTGPQVEVNWMSQLTGIQMVCCSPWDPLLLQDSTVIRIIGGKCYLPHTASQHSHHMSPPFVIVWYESCSTHRIGKQMEYIETF